jgi:hypothetical protein
MDDDDSLTDGCYLDGTGNAAFGLHSHFPKRTLQMLHIRFTNTLKTVRLNSFHNALKAGSHIERKFIKRLPDLFVQEFDGTMPFPPLYLFCNMREQCNGCRMSGSMFNTEMPWLRFTLMSAL